MRGLQFVPPDTKIPFMKWHRLMLGLSALIMVVALLAILLKGFNLGVDFEGGLLIDIKTAGPADVSTMRGTLNELGIGNASIQEFGAPDNVLIRLEKQPGGDAAQQAVINRVREALGPGIEMRRIEVVGPQVSGELLRNAVYAIVSALLAIMAYLWFRFEWQFGVAGILSLIHDVVAILGVFALFGFQVDLTIVAAVMTVAGYSINDSVVVFDRVRENMRKFKTMPISNLIDLSINQTLSRTFITGITTLIVLVCLYVLGGEVLRGFSFAMLFGVIFGTYSSIFVAVPLLLYLKVQRIAARGESAVAETPSP